jgi:hypothetical protein
MNRLRAVHRRALQRSGRRWLQRDIRNCEGRFRLLKVVSLPTLSSTNISHACEMMRTTKHPSGRAAKPSRDLVVGGSSATSETVRAASGYSNQNAEALTNFGECAGHLVMNACLSQSTRHSLMRTITAGEKIALSGMACSRALQRSGRRWLQRDIRNCEGRFRLLKSERRSTYKLSRCPRSRRPTSRTPAR